MAYSAKAQQRGRSGEELVARWLEGRGWRILARGYRRRGSELDIVAERGRTIAVVEVKTRRRTLAFADWERLLPPAKQQALFRGTSFFLRERALPYDTIRLDLALVAPAQGTWTVAGYFQNVAPLAPKCWW